MDEDEALARALQAEESAYGYYSASGAAYYDDYDNYTTSTLAGADSDFEFDMDEDDDDWGAANGKKSAAAKKGKKGGKPAGSGRGRGGKVKKGGGAVVGDTNGLNGQDGEDATTSKPTKERITQQSGMGPWTDDEEKLFLEGLDLYGRNWKQVSSLF